MKFLNNLLFFLRKFIFKNYREDVIVKILKKEIKIIQNNKPKSYPIHIMDFGSGMQPYVINKVINELNSENSENYSVECYDFYDEDILKNLNSDKNIKFFHLNKLDYKKNYDIVIIIDVLHHIGLESTKDIKKILSKISNVTDYIIIKDHFEKNILSRVLLILMDFIGNFHNNVKIPKIYFKKDQFNNLINDLKLIEIKRIADIYYYKQIWLFFRNPDLQFISILKTKNEIK